MTEPISGIGGLKQGTIQGRVAAGVSATGHDTPKINAMDGAGPRSNVLLDCFDIAANSWKAQPLCLRAGSVD